MNLVIVKSGDPNAGFVFDAIPGAVYHVTATDWAAWPVPKPALPAVPWSYVAGLAATSVKAPPDTFTPEEIALLAAAVAAQVVQDPDTPAQPADVAAIADAVASKLSERLAA